MHGSEVILCIKKQDGWKDERPRSNMSFQLLLSWGHNEKRHFCMKVGSILCGSTCSEWLHLVYSKYDRLYLAYPSKTTKVVNNAFRVRDTIHLLVFLPYVTNNNFCDFLFALLDTKLFKKRSLPYQVQS